MLLALSMLSKERVGLTYQSVQQTVCFSCFLFVFFLFFFEDSFTELSLHLR